MLALEYLQTTLSAVVDQADEAEASEFRECMAALLLAPARPEDEDELAGVESGVGGIEEVVDEELAKRLYAERQQLFERLVTEYLPREEQAEPADLRDLCALAAQ